MGYSTVQDLQKAEKMAQHGTKIIQASFQVSKQAGQNTQHNTHYHNIVWSLSM